MQRPALLPVPAHGSASERNCAGSHYALNDGEKVEGRAGEAVYSRHRGQQAWLPQIRVCNFGVFGALGTFFIDGCGDRIASRVLQLCEDCMSASFDRPSRLVQDRVSARWHRGHLGFCRPCF
jgi:hypothetical protein